MEDPRRALHVSLALKAARWLAGTTDEKGRAVPLTTAALATRGPLAENQITRNRLEDFEQMRAIARPMELDQISRALGVDLSELIGQVALIGSVSSEAVPDSEEAGRVVGDVVDQLVEADGSRPPRETDQPASARVTAQRRPA